MSQSAPIQFPRLLRSDLDLRRLFHVMVIAASAHRGNVAALALNHLRPAGGGQGPPRHRKRKWKGWMQQQREKGLR